MSARQVTVEQLDDGVYFDGPDGLVAVPCQWFALCENHAKTTQAHPVLGDVPICDRCKQKTDRLAGH